MNYVLYFNWKEKSTVVIECQSNVKRYSRTLEPEYTKTTHTYNVNLSKKRFKRLKKIILFARIRL